MIYYNPFLTDSHPAIRQGCSAAFSIQKSEDSEVQIGLLVEVYQEKLDDSIFSSISIQASFHD